MREELSSSVAFFAWPAPTSVMFYSSPQHSGSTRPRSIGAEARSHRNAAATRILAYSRPIDIVRKCRFHLSGWQVVTKNLVEQAPAGTGNAYSGIE